MRKQKTQNCLNRLYRAVCKTRAAGDTFRDVVQQGLSEENLLHGSFLHRLGGNQTFCAHLTGESAENEMLVDEPDRENENQRQVLKQFRCYSWRGPAGSSSCWSAGDRVLPWMWFKMIHFFSMTDFFLAGQQNKNKKKTTNNPKTTKHTN